MPELEEAFTWALGLLFYRDLSVSMSDDLYLVVGNSINDIRFTTQVPLAESEYSF